MAAALIACSAGCAVFARAPLTSPASGGPAWHVLTSAHFVLETDLDPDLALRASTALESSLAAIHDLGFAWTEEPRTPIEVVYFRRKADYDAVAPKRSAAQFMWTGLRDFERTPIALVQGDFTLATRDAIQHELTHALVHAYLPQAPTWLSEGMARYYETLEVQDGVATLGTPPRDTRFFKGAWIGQRTSLIPMSEALTIHAMVTMDRDAFYTDMNFDTIKAAAVPAERTIVTHYASAWGLVRFLLETEEHKAVFAVYLGRLHAGEESEEAWERTVGALPQASLEEQFHASLVPPEVNRVRVKYTPVAPPAPRARELSDAEVHVLFARLRHGTTPEERAACDAELAKALARDPKEPAALELRAFRAVERGAYAEAERALDAGLARRPDDRRLLNALGWSRYYAGLQGGDLPREAIAASLDDVASRLAPMAITAAELDLLAHHAFLKSDLDGAIALEKRALALDPSCVYCLSWSAMVMNEKGDVRSAYVTALRARARLPDGTTFGAISEQIERYRRRLVESHEPPPR